MRAHRDTTSIRLGFLPLIDAAIPILAARKGFATARGLSIELVRETSWANIRDRIAIGHFDAAHMLAPMPVAAALGLTPIDVPLIAPIALGLGGNAVTISTPLWQSMHLTAPLAKVGDPREMGEALAKVIATRRQKGLPPLVFGVVHPYSAHNYDLRYWLAACGIKPDQDIEIAIMPPPFLPDALASGRIDGFCVGEPWNSMAVQQGDGHIIVTKSAIWRASPEKVLGLRADWADADPVRLDALLNALIDTALWCALPENMAEMADILSRPDALGLPVETLVPALTGRVRMADGSDDANRDFLVFAQGCANFPWRSHALWFYTQMLRWGQVTRQPDHLAKVMASYRPDLFRKVAQSRGLEVPSVDFKRETNQPNDAQGERSASSRTLNPGGFFDGVDFDPAAVEAYLAQLLGNETPKT